MKRSELKSQANRIKQPKDISNYKKLRNLLVRLTKTGELNILKI